MRILHLESSPGWGGQEIRILRESEGLRKRGHEIILAPPPKSGLAKYGKESGFVIYEILYRKSLKCLFQILQILKKEKIDVINSHSSIDSWIGGIAAKIKKIPIVRTRHLSTAVRKGLNSKLLYNVLTDFVVTTCASIIPKIAEQSGKSIANFQSIPTGVDPKEIVFSDNRFREKLGIGPDDILVGMVCFMRSWKGVHDFLQAAQLLQDEPNLKWVIIGGGHSAEYIKKAQDLKLQVHFTGHLEKPFDAIASLDIFTLLSTAHEGVSQASLQAAYLEKPLITTPTGGLQEVCIDGITGLQVPIFSPDKVAAAVLKLKNNKSLRHQMGLRAKELVEEKFTVEKMLDEMEKVFYKVSS